MTTNLLILVAFVAVVLVALKVAQSVFGTGTSKAAATETAARLVAYPTGSSAVLRRRFVKAVTGQHVVMPSGERLAYAELVVRVAPEDLERLDPDGDTDRLGADAAHLYREHAERAGWKVPDQVRVEVEVDPALRSGWVPPAHGTRGAAPRRPLEPAARPVGWDAVGQEPALPEPSVDAPTMNFPALVPDPAERDDDRGTVDVTPEIALLVGDDEAVLPRLGTTLLGRLRSCPVDLSNPEVSMRHAAIRLRGGRWQVQDVGSTNGTTVDGQRLDPHTWTDLHDGARLALAGVPVGVRIGAPGTVALDGVARRR